MQAKEKFKEKKRVKPGFTVKRFDVPDTIVDKVNMHKQKMELKNGGKELKWEVAAIDLLEKSTRKYKISEQ